MLLSEFEKIMNHLKEISLFDRQTSKTDEQNHDYVFFRDLKSSRKIHFVYLEGCDIILVTDDSENIFYLTKIEIDDENFVTRNGVSVLIKLLVNNFVVGFVDVVRLNPEKPNYTRGRESADDE